MRSSHVTYLYCLFLLNKRKTNEIKKIKIIEPSNAGKMWILPNCGPQCPRIAVPTHEPTIPSDNIT